MMSIRSFEYFLFSVFVFETITHNNVDSAIIIDKRDKLPANALVNNFCVLPGDNEKVSCTEVPGELIKLDVGENSYLKLNSTHFVSPNDFCVLSGNTKYGKLCSSPHNLHYWRKCCKENEIFDATSLTCRRAIRKFRPKDKSGKFQSFFIQRNFSAMSMMRNMSMGQDFNSFHCPGNFVPKMFSTSSCLPKSNGIFQRLDNETLAYESSSGVFLRKKHLKYVEKEAHYCIDGVMDLTTTNCGQLDNEMDGGHRPHDYEYESSWRVDESLYELCKSSFFNEVLVLCMEEQEPILNEDDSKVPKAYFFAALWLSTCPLLVTSAIVNSCIIQRNVHGWILTSYLISMFLVNINSVILILDIHIPISSFSLLQTHGGCGLQDFTMKFIYLSSLCWMSSMCINMLRTFSSSIHQVAIRPHRFLISALFSLGFPVIIVSVSYFVGSLPDTTTSSTQGQQGESNKDSSGSSPLTSCVKSACALYSYKTIPYYSGPIIFLVFCNVVAFLKTSTTIAALRRQAEAVLHQQTKDHLESFGLFAKLFLLTGSIWMIRVVLLVLQIQGLYVTWYGVALEAVFSIPEVVFPMIIFHHREFIKWACRKSPLISSKSKPILNLVATSFYGLLMLLPYFLGFYAGILLKCCPFCKKEVILKGRTNSPDSQSVGFQLNSVDNQNQISWSVTNHTPVNVASNATLSTSSNTGSNGISPRKEIITKF